MSNKPLDKISRPGDRLMARDINDLRREIKRRTVRVVGARQMTRPGGTEILVGGGTGTTLVTVRATTTITARSGRTWGTGSGVRTSYSGSGASSDIAGAITLKNPSECELESGWEGHARPISGTVYAIVALG